MAINTTVNASIGKAPFEVLYGGNIPMPVDIILSNQSTVDPYATTFASKMQSLVKAIKSAMSEAQASQKHFYDL